jgi:hypothetical protein
VQDPAVAKVELGTLDLPLPHIGQPRLELTHHEGALRHPRIAVTGKSSTNRANAALSEPRDKLEIDTWFMKKSYEISEVISEIS